MFDFTGSYMRSQLGGIGDDAGPTITNAAKIGSQNGSLFGADNGLFSGANMGSTLQGFGTLASVVGNIFAQNKEAKYKEKLFDMEEKRIEREKKRQDKYDTGMTNAWS
jgi:hypothetical protein